MIDYKGIKLGSKDDHEISIWIESDVGKLDENFTSGLNRIISQDMPTAPYIGHFYQYDDGYGHFRGQYFPLDIRGVFNLITVYKFIESLKCPNIKMGVAVYANDFIHTNNNLDEVTFEEFLKEVGVKKC